MEIEDRNMISEKARHSKSLQRLKDKTNNGKKKKSGKIGVGKGQTVVYSQNLLKNIRFDTPEKNPFPKPLHGTLDVKESSPRKGVKAKTPFISDASIVSKYEIFNMIKKAQGTNKLLNPKLFTPVLTSQKTKGKFQSLSPTRPISPNTPKKILPIQDIFQINLIPQTQKHELINTRPLKKLGEVLENTNKKGLFSEDHKRKSLGFEEDGPTFLSERLSYDCDSNQSLKYQFDNKHKDAFALGSEVCGSIQSSSIYEEELFDIETQTDGLKISCLLKSLDDPEIKLGIKFVSQIAKFAKTLK